MTGSETDLITRVARLETGQDYLRTDISRVEQEVRDFRGEFTKSRQGMTRSEKIALAGVSISLLLAVLAALALFLRAPA